MLIWSKRRTHLQIWGREAGDTRLGAGGRLVGVETASGVTGGVALPPQEAKSKARRSPKKRQKLRFIVPFTSKV
jgi:hypothetical protein